MKRRATVVLHEGRLMAEVLRTEACQQCRACQFGQQERMFVELPAGAHRPGEEIELELPEKQFAVASILAYGLPVLLLFLGLGIGSLLGLQEIWQAACAFAGLAVGLGIIKLLDPKLRKMRPVSRPCNSEKFTR